MHADSDDDQHKHDNMNKVESLILEASEYQCRRKHGYHGQASDDTHYLFQFEQISERSELCVCYNVKDCVEQCENDCAVSGSLVKDIQPLVGICCQESKRSILQSQKSNKSNVAGSDPSTASANGKVCEVRLILPAHSFCPVPRLTEIKILKKESNIDGNIDCKDKSMAEGRKEWHLAK